MTLLHQLLSGFATIPLLDWSGFQFLMFYICALIVLALWCRRGVRKSLNRFDNPQETAVPEDPYELAFLSAGPGRVVQLAVARLIQQDMARWKSGLLGARLVATVDTVPINSPPPEKCLLERMIAVGDKGIPVSEAGTRIAPSLRSIEVRLASLGLRPTHEERRGSGWGRVIPLILLVILGIVKLFIGLGRDKPVIYLITLLVITIIVIVRIVSFIPRLTPSGESVLAKLRARNEAARRAARSHEAGQLGLMSNSVALFGPAALATFPVFAAIHGDLDKLHAKAAAGGGGGCSSGCGGGSSCGSSGGDGGGSGGCGGGGCGGCGGD